MARVLGREVAPGVVQVDVVERRSRRRHRVDREVTALEPRENRRDRFRSVRHSRAHKAPVDTDIGRPVDRAHDLRGVFHAAVRLAELDRHELAAQIRLQLLGSAFDDDLAAADDRDALGEPVGFFEVVRREQDREALLLREPLDLDPHRGPRLRVEPGGRLVEEEHLRLVDETGRDVEAALHPAGVAARDAVGGVAQSDELEQLVDPLAQRGAAHRVDPALEHQVLAPGGLPVDARILRDVTGCTAHAVRMAHDVFTGDGRASGVGLRERRERTNGRRLAGAVRAEETEDLAVAYGERDAVKRLHVLVALAEVLGDDRVHGRRV